MLQPVRCEPTASGPGRSPPPRSAHGRWPASRRPPDRVRGRHLQPGIRGCRRTTPSGPTSIGVSPPARCDARRAVRRNASPGPSTTTSSSRSITVADRRGRTGRVVLDGGATSGSGQRARREPGDRATGLDVREGGQRRRVQRRPCRRAPRCSQRAHRILVVLADGMTRGSVEALAEPRRRRTWAGPGARHRHRRRHGAGGLRPQQIVERPDELTKAMVDGVRSALVPEHRRRGRRHLVGPRDRTITRFDH